MVVKSFASFLLGVAWAVCLCAIAFDASGTWRGAAFAAAFFGSAAYMNADDSGWFERQHRWDYRREPLPWHGVDNGVLRLEANVFPEGVWWPPQFVHMSSDGDYFAEDPSTGERLKVVVYHVYLRVEEEGWGLLIVGGLDEAQHALFPQWGMESHTSRVYTLGGALRLAEQLRYYDEVIHRKWKRLRRHTLVERLGKSRFVRWLDHTYGSTGYSDLLENLLEADERCRSQAAGVSALKTNSS